MNVTFGSTVCHSTLPVTTALIFGCLLQGRTKIDPNKIYDLFLAYAKGATVRGPFNNKWINAVGGYGYSDKKDPDQWLYSIEMSDGTTASATINAYTGKVSDFRCDWPPKAPCYPPIYQKYVDLAKRWLLREGYLSPLILKSALVKQVNRVAALEVIFNDEDAYQYPVYVKLSSLSRIYPPRQAEDKKCSALLLKLGVSGPLRQAYFEGPERVPPANEIHAPSFIDRNGSQYTIFIDRDSPRIYAIEHNSGLPGSTATRIQASPVDLEWAHLALAQLGLPDVTFLRSEASGETITLTYRTLATTQPFAVHLAGEISFYRSHRRIAEFRSPPEWRIRKAYDRAPIDPRYLAVCDAMIGSDFPDLYRRRFAKVEVRAPDMERWRGIVSYDGFPLRLFPNKEYRSATYLGWITPDHKRVALLNGLECNVDHFDGYADIDGSIPDPGETFYIRSPKYASSVTPYLALKSGHPKCASHLYHWLSHFSPDPLIGLTGDLEYLYRKMVIDAILNEDDLKALQMAERLARVEMLRQARAGSQAEAETIEEDLRKSRALCSGLRQSVALHEPLDVDLKAIGKEKEASKISDLIRALEYDFQLNGSFPLSSKFFGPAASALVELGPNAVLAILDAIENDDRFTHCITDKGASDLSLLPVRSLELEIVKTIWPKAPAVDLSDPVKAAARLRAAWAAAQMHQE